MIEESDMGLMVVCDHCRKPINGELNSRQKQVHRVRVWDADKDFKGEKAHNFDLCASCRQEVEAFISAIKADKQ